MASYTYEDKLGRGNRWRLNIDRALTFWRGLSRPFWPWHLAAGSVGRCKHSATVAVGFHRRSTSTRSGGICASPSASETVKNLLAKRGIAISYETIHGGWPILVHSIAAMRWSRRHTQRVSQFGTWDQVPKIDSARPPRSPAISEGDLGSRASCEWPLLAAWVPIGITAKVDTSSGRPRMSTDFVFVQDVIGGDQGPETKCPARQDDILDCRSDARAADLLLMSQVRIVALGNFIRSFSITQPQAVATGHSQERR